MKTDYPDIIKEIEETLINYMSENDFKLLETEIPDKWKYSIKKLAYPDEFFNCFEDYQKSVGNLKKEDFFSRLKNDHPSDEEIEKTKEISKLLNFENGEELKYLYLKSDVLLLTCVFKKFIKVSGKEFGINPLLCFSTWLYLAVWFEIYKSNITNTWK